MQSYLRNDYVANVTRYSYPINIFSGIDALSDENALPLSYCSYCYNVGFRNGALTNGIGISKAEINGNLLPNVGIMGKVIKKCYIYYRYDYINRVRDDRIVAMLDDGYIYTTKLDGGNSFEKSDMVFPTTVASALNYHYNGEDVLLIFSSAGGMYIYNGTTSTYYQGVPAFSSVCLHYERVYGTVEGENRVYFSDDLDPTNWQTSITEGGYITFPDEGGIVKKVVSFNDYVFIFRENAIHRLTAYTDLTEFKLTKIFSTYNKIYPDTLAICSDRIVFLMEDGLYSFDGYTPHKIYSEIFPLIDSKEYSIGCYFNYKYYLATTIKNLDEQCVGDEELCNMKNNGMIIFDFDLKNVSIFRGGDIGNFMPVNVGNICELLVGFNNYRCNYLGKIDESGKLFDMPLKKLWQGPFSNLSQLAKDKILRKIFLLAYYPLTITVNTDKKTSVEISASSKIQMIPINQKAESVSISISTESDKVYLNSMLFEFDLMRRRNIDG